jgi:hypothetical protein
MTAAITDDSYNQQVTSIFDFLKNASPQQLAQVSQVVQRNPQSPEATALAMATNYQQQMRSGQAQAPQQTVYQKQIGQLLASMQPQQAPPMQAGIAAAGPNQFALQAAAQQDPMRNAGIGAAPENTPQQAATGGLVALAQGGAVRGFSGLGDSYASLQDEDVTNNPDLWSQYSPRKAHPSMGRSIDIALEKPDVRDTQRYPVNLETLAEEYPEAESGGSAAQRALHPLDKAFEMVTGSMGSLGSKIKAPDLGTSILSPTKWRGDVAPGYSAPGIGMETGLTDISGLPEAWRTTRNPLISDEASPQTPPAQQTPPGNAPKTPPSAAPTRRQDQRPRNLATPQTPQTPATPATPARGETKKPELTAEQQIGELEKLLNVDTPMAMELKGQMEKRHADAKKENTLMALAQGIGSMMAAQTPHAGQAVGAGLLAAASAYQGGEDRLDRQQSAIDALQLRPELMKQANRQTAFTSMMDQEKARISALAKFREDRAKFGEQVALKNLEGTQQESLKRMDIGADRAKLAIQQRNAEALERLKRSFGEAPTGSEREKSYIDFINAVNKDGTIDLAQLPELYRQHMEQARNPQAAPPQPQPGRVGNTNMLITPPR